MKLFPSTAAAYSAAQGDAAVEKGATLVVVSEGVVGLAWSWPVAVTVALGEFHGAVGDADALIKSAGLTLEQVRDAVDVADAHGFPVAAWARTIASSALPRWMAKYTTGQAIGYSQGVMAYAAYYGVDGEGDLDTELEERVSIMPRPMISYASRTGTRRNLEALRQANWRLLVSATGALRTEGMRYALDNGAWTAFQQGRQFDEKAFGRAVDRLGENADWIVLPDIVAGGLESLELSLRWLERLRGIPTKLLLAVQNGMELDDVREYLSPAVGIFVGGDTEWKLATVNSWGQLARRRHCHLHVGRVNSAKRIALCAAAGVNSVDGTSATRFSKSLPRLDGALRRADGQPDLFNPTGMTLDEVRLDCCA